MHNKSRCFSDQRGAIAPRSSEQNRDTAVTSLPCSNSNDVSESATSEKIDNVPGLERDNKSGHLRSFNPIHLVLQWHEPKARVKRCTIPVCLPSCVRKGQFSVRIADSGLQLVLTVNSRIPFVDSNILHRKWFEDRS